MVPRRRTLGTVQLECHRALRPEDGSVCFERAAGAVLELDERTDVILVRHLSGGVVGRPAVIVRALPWRGQRTLLDEDLLDGDDPPDRSGQILRHVDGVGHDVAEGSVSGLVLQESPRQQPEPVTAVHGEELPPVVGQVTEPALVDETLRVGHERRPPVVVPAARDHSRLARRHLDRGRGLRRDADGLLTEDVLAGGGSGLGEFLVERVRSGDVYHVDVVPLDERPPVVQTMLETEVLRCHVAAFLDVVAHGHEPGADAGLRVVPGNAGVGTGVGLAHPPESDHTDADLCAHPSSIIRWCGPRPPRCDPTPRG